MEFFQIADANEDGMIDLQEYIKAALSYESDDTFNDEL